MTAAGGAGVLVSSVRPRLWGPLSHWLSPTDAGPACTTSRRSSSSRVCPAPRTIDGDMRMRLGKRADYSVRAVLHLARHDGDGRRKARQIAADMQIPANYLPQVLAELVRVGLVDSEPGPDGGYRLASSPTDVTLLEVIEAVEGPMTSEECVLRGGPCRWEDSCAVHGSWAEAQEALRARLRAVTFAELAAVDGRLDGVQRRGGTPSDVPA